MSSEALKTDWLNPASLKSAAARRFAEFCQQNLQTPSHAADADPGLSLEAARLVLERLEQRLPTGGRP